MSEEEYSCNKEDFNNFIKKNKDIIVVISMAEDCPSCEYYDDVIEEVLKENPEAPIAELYVDETADEKCVELIKELSIETAPAVIGYKEGKEYKRISIELNAEKDIENLKNLIKEIKK